MTLLPPTNEACGKVMFLHLSVILFRGVASQHAVGGAGCTPLGRHHPQADKSLPPVQTPLDQTPPFRILRDTVNKRAVSILDLLECILVSGCKFKLILFSIQHR